MCVCVLVCVGACVSVSVWVYNIEGREKERESNDVCSSRRFTEALIPVVVQPLKIHETRQIEMSQHSQTQLSLSFSFKTMSPTFE